MRQESIEKVNELKSIASSKNLNYENSISGADKLNALWLDPFSPPSRSHHDALSDAGINLLSVVTLEDLKKTLNKTNLIVIRLKDNLSLFDEVFYTLFNISNFFQLYCFCQSKFDFIRGF